MNTGQWQTLVDVVEGKPAAEPPVGFIIDSPWIPGWCGISTLDYYTRDSVWLEANLKVLQTFPEATFLPGFWSEYGMCTEPSAFGSKLVWEALNLPHADKVIADLGSGLPDKPNVKKDGLLPFVINRLKSNQDAIRAEGHEIKFAVSRGPFNIATFLMGTTEFLMASQMQPDETHKLLRTITDFSLDWLEYQIEQFPTIDGILILDDIIGFVGEDDFKTLMHPYLAEIFGRFPVAVKFLHNDAAGLVSAPYLPELGVNLFNPSFEHPLHELISLTQGKVTILGNIPPRDVLAQGTEEDARKWVAETKASLPDSTRVLWSCGGGMPQGVPTENIRAFINAVHE